MEVRSLGLRETLISRSPEIIGELQRRNTARVQVGQVLVLQVVLFLLAICANQRGPLGYLELVGFFGLGHPLVYVFLSFKFPVAARSFAKAILIFWGLIVAVALVLFVHLFYSLRHIYC